MKESELRDAVEKRRAITEGTWAYLEREQKLHDAMEEIGEAEEDPVGYLVSEIDAISAAAPDVASRFVPGNGIPYSKAFNYINEDERKRLEARAAVLAKHVSSDEAVQSFRNRFLGGELLTPEQAQEFVTSHANQNLPVQWFDKHGVSFSGHTIETRAITTDFRGEVIEFTIRPAGIDCRVEKHALSEEYGGGRTLSVVGDPPDVRDRRRNDVPLPTSEGSRDFIAHDGLLGLGYWRGFTGYVRTDSPLGVLRDLGTRLAERYRGWKSNYATRFVLTGEPPEEQSPLWTERGPVGEIVIHVAPWVSPDSVKNAYMRQLWFRGWMNERYGGSKAKRRRRLSDKNLKLLRFITDRIDDRGRAPKDRGAEVAAEWDAEYPEWAYRGNTRGMWRDYARALREVAPEATQKGHR